MVPSWTEIGVTAALLLVIFAIAMCRVGDDGDDNGAIEADGPENQGDSREQSTKN